jgi:hypothetical protein
MARSRICRQPTSGCRVVAGVALLGIAASEAKGGQQKGDTEELQHALYIRRVVPEDKWNDANHREF